MRVLMLTLCATAALSSCAWVKMAPGADAVRVVRADQPLSACERRGEVSVSVKDRLGPYERNDIRVRDELETLARNEAPSLGGDTIQPRGEPADGEQRFSVWRCGATAPGPAAARPAASGGEAETYPIGD